MKLTLVVPLRCQVNGLSTLGFDGRSGRRVRPVRARDGKDHLLVLPDARKLCFLQIVRPVPVEFVDEAVSGEEQLGPPIVMREMTPQGA